MVERCVRKDFWFRTESGGARDHDVPLVNVSVAQPTAGAFLGFSVQLRGNFNGTCVGEIGWGWNIITEGWGGRKKSVHGSL